MTENKDLKEVYDKGELDFYPGYLESFTILANGQWKDKTVLEIGCGEGHLASMIHYAGAKAVLGIDYSEKQIERARGFYKKPRLGFVCMEYQQMQDKFDIIVMQGVLEHLDKPWEALQRIMENNLNSPGVALVSVPNWANPRGYIYHTCRMLYGAKMTLTDLHFFSVSDFADFAEANGYKIEGQMTDISLGCGDDMITDLRKRIPKADPKISFKNLDAFLGYISKQLPEIKERELSGATVCYKIMKPPAPIGMPAPQGMC